MPRRLRCALAAATLLCVVSMPRLEAQDLSTITSEEPFRISGALSLQAQHFHTTAPRVAGRPDATGFLYFTPTVSVYGIQFPFSVYLTTSEATFRQPFNEYGVSPRYKWITAHLGYRSVQYSSYSLAFQRWLGAGVDVRGDWLRVSAMYGRFQAAAGEDTARGAAGIYRRMGYAAKIGFGSDRNFVDMNILRAWDDSTSIARTTGRTPPAAENTVLALAGRVQLVDNALSLEGELAASAYTRDLSAKEEDVPDVPAIFGALMPVRLSTHANIALRSALSYVIKTFRIALRYERVEPDFQSMGVGYVSGDREDITIAPQATLFRTLRLSASLGLRRNNLMGDRLATTRRVISSFGTSWQATQDLGLDLRYANYASTSSDGRVRVTDTTRVENVSQMITVSPRYMFGTADARQTLSLMLMHQSYDDRNLITGALNNNRGTTVTLSYGGTVGETALTGSLTSATTTAASYDNNTWSISGSGTRTYFEGALSVQLSLSYSIVSAQTGHDGQFLPGLTGSYRLSDLDAFTFSTNYSQNLRSINPTTEIITSATYTRSF